MALTLSSTRFTHQGEIPSQYTCEGSDISPPLSWSGAPENTKSFALIMDDPDAPDPKAPQRVWVHWVLYNLPASASVLVEAVAPDRLPAGTNVGRNDAGRTGYQGPCPPIGRHRYFHKLYALDTILPDLGAANKKELMAAMEGHVLAQAELIGTYQKSG
jgi:Raf kinase inhibitor-like YbhB/YbcL family protein